MVVPVLNATVNGNIITLIDATVYDDTVVDDGRGDILVDFSMIRKDDGGDLPATLNAYNPVSVAQVDSGPVVDGCFTATMTTTVISGSYGPIVTTYDILVIDGLCTAVNVNDGDIRVTDTTVYGTGTPANRANVAVTVSLTKRDDGSDIAQVVPTHDPSTFTTLDITGLTDGYYQVTLQWLPAVGGLGVTEVHNFLRYDDTLACVSRLETAWIAESCGEEDSKNDFTKYMKGKASVESIATLVTAGDFDRALCLLEGIQAECTNENCEGC